MSDTDKGVTDDLKDALDRHDADTSFWCDCVAHSEGQLCCLDAEHALGKQVRARLTDLSAENERLRQSLAVTTDPAAKQMWEWGEENERLKKDILKMAAREGEVLATHYTQVEMERDAAQSRITRIEEAAREIPSSVYERAERAVGEEGSGADIPSDRLVFASWLMLFRRALDTPSTPPSAET